MKVCSSIVEVRAEVRAACGGSRGADKMLGLVPTMGALHDGHLSLVRLAREKCDVVAASIFVNPTQFGPTEDLAKYPRQLARDREMLEKNGVDILFAPPVEEMYPGGSVTWVVVEGLSDRLDGRSRPGHFRGVTTVVSKLFHIIEPQIAYFGQKDAAQLAVIRRMVRDLRFPIEIVAGPIIREPDGLAMSSRNAYLSQEDRLHALTLHHSLRSAQARFEAGEHNAAELISAARNVFESEPTVRLDYIEIVNAESLDPVETISGDALLAVAAYVGKTRLIDNVILRESK
jgi:pantoate--beta-alanine ligase